MIACTVIICIACICFSKIYVLNRVTYTEKERERDREREIERERERDGLRAREREGV